MVRFAADIPVGIAGRKGVFRAFALEAASPAFLREGALEALGGQLDISCDVLFLRKRGVGIPLKVNQVGDYVLSVVALEESVRDRE